MTGENTGRARSLATQVRGEIAANAAVAVTIAVAAVLPFLPFVTRVTADGERVLAYSSVAIAAGAVLLALLSRIAFMALALVYVPLTLLSVHLVRHFSAGQRGWRLNQPDSRVEAYFESPANETIEYFHAHWWPSDWVLLGIALIYLVLLAWLLWRSRPLTPTARWAVLVAAVGWCWAATSQRIDRQLPDWPQYQLVYAAVEAQPRFEQLAERNAHLDSRPLAAADCSSRYRKVVIVIGESAATGRMSVFGHSRETTPFADGSSPYAFVALSPSNQTRYSLAMMLTAAAPGKFESFYREHSLVNQLEACGYSTLWISNQGRVGRQDSMAASLAREADRSHFLNPLSYKQVKFDGQLVGELELLGAFTADRQATFIHLIGSHTQYARRYPDGFGFRPVIDTVDAYDNSILYTDHVLSELQRRFGKKGVLFVYVADHGEVVTNRLYGHGFSPGYREEYLTPLLIWTDDAKSMARLKDATGGARINLESFDDALNFLVGRTSEPALSTRSVVTNLGPSNPVRFEDLQSVQRPASASTNRKRRPAS
jgi:glucan phosphoethanolaminetransferase (alkaline phosphatase superfamily)